MARFQIYMVMFAVHMILCGGVSAQYNSDFKTVAQKKIKTAIAFSIGDHQDTTWVHYFYDTEGRITEQRWNSYGVHQNKYIYDRNGNLIFRYSWTVYQRQKQNQDGVWNWLPDTSSREFIKYDITTNEEIYNLYLAYANNVPNYGRLDIKSGDTSFHYDFHNGQFMLHSMEIRAKVDTIKNGYALLCYGVIYPDTTFNSQFCDTTFHGCYVTVFNKHEEIIRKYSLIYDYQRLDTTRMPAGHLFSPLNRTDYLIHGVTRYKTKMKKEGDWLVQTITDRDTGKTFTGKHTYAGPPMVSLEEIKKHGTVTFEYYH